MSAEKYDDTLLPFMVLMRRELHANSAKGDRPGWLAMQPGQCLLEIYWHVAKLSAAVKNGDQALIAEHAADVANMAMMQADIAGLLQPSVESQTRAASVTPLVGAKCKNCGGTGRDGDVGGEGQPSDIECGVCYGSGLIGRYRSICPKGNRCLSGCLANEPCYLSHPIPPAQAADSVLEDAADPLQGAANWLAEAHGQFCVAVLQGCLMIGYNRAKRLHDAAIAARKQGCAT